MKSKCKRIAEQVRKTGFIQVKYEQYTDSQIINEEKTVDMLTKNFDIETGKPLDKDSIWGSLSDFITTLRKGCADLEDLFDVQAMRAIHYMDIKLGKKWCDGGTVNEEWLS